MAYQPQSTLSSTSLVAVKNGVCIVSLPSRQGLYSGYYQEVYIKWLVPVAINKVIVIFSF
jgi:hypothetical protein